MSDRKALIVGINQFANYPGSALQGCVNDAENMFCILRNYLGFGFSDVEQLTDARATKATIMKELNKMVAGAIEGRYKRLIFSFSSHGTQVPDVSGDESDYADEAFCPHDLAAYGGAWDPEHIITDDELYVLFAQIPKDVILDVFLDTCHSGTGLRAIDRAFARKIRWMPPPSAEASKLLKGKKPRSLSQYFTSEKEFSKTPLYKRVLWSGCRSDQTSADAYISGSWQGAFTYYFCTNLAAKKNRIARKGLIKLVNQGLSGNSYSQVAQLECTTALRRRKIV